MRAGFLNPRLPGDIGILQGKDVSTEPENQAADTQNRVRLSYGMAHLVSASTLTILGVF